MFKIWFLGRKSVPGNEICRISRTYQIIHIIAVALCGLLSAAALPPLNYYPLAFLALVPLILTGMHCRVGFTALCGFAFGWLWAFASFNFLREIQGSFGCIPYLLATVLGLYFAVFAAFIPFLHRYLRLTQLERLRTFDERQLIPPKLSFSRELWFAAAVSCLYIMLEWGRAFALPWNLLATTLYKVPVMLQLGAFGGAYAVSFVLIFVNVAIAQQIDVVWYGFSAQAPGRRRRCGTFLLAIVMILGTLLFGLYRTKNFKYPAVREVRFGLAQGNISQRRNATYQEAEEALNINFALLKELAENPIEPEIAILPESATPIRYSENSPLSNQLRWQTFLFVETHKIPLFMGVIDFEPLSDNPKDYLTFNRALLFKPGKGRHPVAKFDKIQRVPFGEFVPFRNFLPDFLVKIIDMNRDLTPGNDYTPIELLDNVYAGVSICFEDVFPYVARGEALRGANLLLVISNDAWYPESSEPEQHLANAVMRTIETGLPMVRCGNNASSIVIDPLGRAVDGLRRNADGSVDTFGKFRAAGVVTAAVPLEVEPTFHTRFGSWFQYLCLIIAVCSVFSALNSRMADGRILKLKK